MQRLKVQIVMLFAALTLALGGTGAFLVTQAVTGTTETTSAHTYYTYQCNNGWLYRVVWDHNPYYPPGHIPVYAYAVSMNSHLCWGY